MSKSRAQNPATGKSPSTEARVSVAALAAATPETLAAQAAAWDAARQQLRLVTEAAAVAQSAVSALTDASTVEERTAADEQLAACQAAVIEAQRAIDMLSTDQQDPEAKASEGKTEISATQDRPSDGDASRLAGGRTPAPILSPDATGAVQAPQMNTPQEGSGTAREAPGGTAPEGLTADGIADLSASAQDGVQPAPPSTSQHPDGAPSAVDRANPARFPDDDVIYAEADRQLAAVTESIRAVVREGRRVVALVHIEEQRRQAWVLQESIRRLDSGLAALALEVRDSAVGYPLTQLWHDGQLRAIGQPVSLSPELLDELVAAGTMSRTPPAS